MQPRQTNDEMTAHPARRSGAFWRGWALAMSMGVVLVGMATLPPFVEPAAREALMQAFAPVCHQLPARSPEVGGVPLAVCHRCYGIYWGLPLAALAFLLLARWDGVMGRRAPWLLALAAVPAGVDWLLGVLQVWENTPLSRVTTGLVFGLVAGVYLARAFSQLFTGSAATRSPASVGAAAGPPPD